jgi:hypothetical protein
MKASNIAVGIGVTSCFMGGLLNEVVPDVPLTVNVGAAVAMDVEPQTTQGVDTCRQVADLVKRLGLVPGDTSGVPQVAQYGAFLGREGA